MNSPATPTTKRRESVPHVSVLKGNIAFAIPIDVMNQDTLAAANKLLNAAAQVLREGKAHAAIEATLGKVRGDLLP